MAYMEVPHLSMQCVAFTIFVDVFCGNATMDILGLKFSYFIIYMFMLRLEGPKASSATWIPEQEK